MDWVPYLKEGEVVRWEGRPAPRCYTFRNWKHALFGCVLLLMTIWWQFMAVGVAREYALPWMSLIPVPFLMCAFYLAIGQLVLSRLGWEKVFFAITDRHIIVTDGLLRQRVKSLPLCELSYFQLRFASEALGSLFLSVKGVEGPLVLSCIEHPRIPSALLEEAIHKNGIEI